jgi:hypothetical protein
MNTLQLINFQKKKIIVKLKKKGIFFICHSNTWKLKICHSKF